MKAFWWGIIRFTTLLLTTQLLTTPLLTTQYSVANTQAHAETPRDFAYGITLKLDAQRVYEFVLPDEIYRHSQTHNLADMRIFEVASNNSVAYAILPPQNPTLPAIIERKPLTFFTLPRTSSNTTADDFNIRVQRDASGQILQINTVNTVNTVNTANTAADTEPDIAPHDYLLDLGDAQQKKPQQLHIDWNHQQLPQAQLTLQTSDDLLHWTNIGSGVLIHVQQADQALLTNTININPQQRYLKIDSKTAALQIQEINGLYASQTDQPDLRRWWDATFIKHDSEHNQYHYTLPPALPIVAVRVIPATNTTLKNVRLNYSNIENQHHYLTTQDWYQFNMQDKTIQSPEYMTPLIHAKHWSITLEKNAPALTQRPQLSAAWQAARVRFLSAAAGEYCIAYGSQKIQTISPSLPQELLKADLETTALTLPPSLSLGGEAALKPERDYSSLILWAVLLCALLLLGGIAKTLLKTTFKDTEEKS